MKSTLYKIATGILISTIGFTSCEVNRIPETDITDPSFWQNEADLKMGANRLYPYLPGLPVTNDVWSDDAYGTDNNSTSDGTRITPGTDSFYGDQYALIRWANNIMEKSEVVLENGTSPELVDIYLGEARFFRAWGYYELFQRYGAVPLILKTLTEDAPELLEPQASREEIIQTIYADLDIAIDLLPNPSEQEASDYGRITRTAALALKSRAALFEGTRAKFHEYGDPQSHLTIAREAALEIIRSGEHDIFPNYFDLFQYEGNGRNNKENILVRMYGQNTENSISSHVTQRNLETGAANPTKYLADSYLMTDGLPIDQSPLYEQPTNTVEVFDNRDPRMGDTFFKAGDEYIGTRPVYTIPPLNFQKTGFGNRRYANLDDWQVSRSYIDRAIIRYAEVLLIYAEATYELNGSISDEDLNISINELRSRESVNMPPLTNAFVAGNNLDMREEIRRERRVELALEGFRYWDIIRWKIAEDVLKRDILGNYYFDEFKEQEGTDPLLTDDNIILLQRAENRFFDPAKDYLWPFSTEQLSLNPNLEQNPGW